MNIIQDFLMAYAILVLLSPMAVIGCINAVLSQVHLSGYPDSLCNTYKIDLNSKSYFSVLVLVLITFI